MKTCPVCSASYGNDVGFCPRDGAALRSGATLEPGAIIRKKYEILSEIGRGGMGVVYRARHLIWNEEKALKVLVASGAAAQQGLKGLMAEALVMRQLQHPHIVRVEDADYTEDDQPFVVMEYVDGESVRQRVDREGPLAADLALQIAAQTCSALSAAHQKGIVHRDIKPQNLLLAKGADGSETVKVIDFGIAKVREEAGLGFTGMMTGTTGLFVGTPGYASPEQALGMRGSDLDGRTDLYSLGLVLYEMLTGRLPFAGDTPVAVLVQRLHTLPLPPDQLRPDLNISPDVSKLVMKALEKERENRHRSAEEMERAINAVLSRRAEREREKAETTRLAAVRAERERLAREEAERKNQEQAARHPPLPGKDYGGTTRVGDGQKFRRRVLTYGAAGLAVALAAAALFIARYSAEKPVQEVAHQVSSAPAPQSESLPPVAARPPTDTSLPQTGSSARLEPPPKTEIAKNPAPTPGVEQPQGKPSVPPLRAVMNPKDGLRYVWIPPGTFTMGCSAGDSECHNDEKPAHEVTITKGFWLGQTEVRQAAWQRVMGTDPSHFKGANLPVDQVRWYEAQAYCQAVGGRLPTEAEWEYAARAGSVQSRYGDIDRIAWYAGNSGIRTHEVAQKQPNAFGLYDVLGNVWEWTADWYGGYTPGSAVDPAGPVSGQYRALRGGSWFVVPGFARVSVRIRVGPGDRSDVIGLRCAWE